MIGATREATERRKPSDVSCCGEDLRSKREFVSRRGLEIGPTKRFEISCRGILGDGLAGDKGVVRAGADVSRRASRRSVASRSGDHRLGSRFSFSLIAAAIATSVAVHKSSMGVVGISPKSSNDNNGGASSESEEAACGVSR